MNSRFNKGFTLIELLVVIAIIGILSSIILVSLNSARNKGRDASAKGSLSSARTAAEIYYDTYNNYGNTGTGACEDTDVATLITAAKAQTTGTGSCNSVSGNGGATAYAADITLNNGQFFCVDSTGFAGTSTQALGTLTACVH
jgi:type IV pilus assembly protein PilE